MRTISLSHFRDAVIDAGDTRLLAAAITADARSIGWPSVITRDLWRIATRGPASPVDLAKLRICLARLEACHD
jgi:hypothetical protein